jgi:preprotein translocase SecE subunit
MGPITYLKQCREELAKVMWPTRQKTIRNTMLVIAMSVGMAAFLGLTDFILDQALQYFLNR